MRVLLAPDKFKGSLSALDVARHLAAGLKVSAPDLEVILAPVADGGDGTLDALTPSGFAIRTAAVTGSLGAPRVASYGVRHATAVIELAEADGLRHLPPGQLRPLEATSYGVGGLIGHALDAGCRHLILGLGGSANTDGGTGMLQALGLRLFDDHGQELGPGGANLRGLASIDATGLDPRLTDAVIVIAGDVDNPLLGPTGAAAVYAPQKGASPAEVAVLETGLQRWAEIVCATTGQDLSNQPGAGAAGGVGFAALTFLHAAVRPGIELILDLIHFDDLLTGVALVVTGEGSLDEQSLNGKAPVGVAAAAARHGIPTVAVAGRSLLTDQQITRAGFSAVYTLLDREPDITICLAQAGRLLEELVVEITASLPPGRTVHPH
jgi:glycerate 2-kinase